MSEGPINLKRFFAELPRRKIWWVAGVYLAVSWVGVQVIGTLEETLNLPAWIDTVAVVLLMIGFPIALVLAWAQEIQAPENEEATAPETPQLETTFDSHPTHSVAVLPLNNLSDEKDFDWAADGMTEDLTTKLGMMWPLRVTARNSAFSYKGLSPDLREAGNALGVRFIVEGSLRPLSETIRVTTQLIDTRNGDHVWAENRDISKTNLEKVQDEFVDRLAFEIHTEICNRERRRIHASPIEDLNVLDTIVLANDIAYYPFSREGISKATGILERCLERHPNSSALYPTLAMNHAWRCVYADDQSESREFGRKAFASIQSALTANPSSADVNELAVGVMRTLGRPEDAMLYANNYRALSDEPSSQVGQALIGVGRYREALEEFRRWTELAGTQHPERSRVMYNTALAHFGLEELEKASGILRQLRITMPLNDVLETYASVLGLLGHIDEARRELKALKALATGSDFETVQRWYNHLYSDEKFIQRQIEGLRLAGMDSAKTN